MKMLMQDGSLKPKTRYLEIMQRVFNLLTEEIGIDKYDVELPAEFYRQEEVGEITGASAAKAAVASNGKGEYKLVLSAGPLGCLATSLAHELVHMRQYLSGELKDTEDGDTYWQGKKMSRGAIMMAQIFGGEKSIPYEKEPYARMFKLAQTVLKQLSSEDIEYMNRFPCPCLAAGKSVSQCWDNPERKT